MTAERRLFSLVAVLAVISMIIVGVALTLLYDSAFEQQRKSLIETARSQARLIEAVAEFDEEYSADFEDGGSHAATLSQIRLAHARYKGIGETGEFTLARLEGDSIVFLLRHRHYDLDNPEPVPIDSDIAEPMRRALRHESGTVVSKDYRGEIVLAAYEPVSILRLGIVAKIDLSEIRAPFIRVGLISIAATIVVILFGILMIYRVGNPMVRDITERKANEAVIIQQKRELQDILNAIQVGIVVVDPETRQIVNCNPAVLKMINATEGQVIGNVCHSFICPEQVGQCDFIDGHLKIDQAEKELMTIDGTRIPILKTISSIMVSGKELLLETFIDTSEQKKAELERQGLELEMIQARKLEAVGSLAAGIAHEINSPIQFVGDNTNFLSDSFMSLMSLIEAYDNLWQKANGGANMAELGLEKVRAEENVELEYMRKEIPAAIEQTLEGVRRVSTIVLAMKNFAHSDQGKTSMSNLNEMLKSTLTVARNELKYVAVVETDFDNDLPEIECYRDDLNQVFLNLLVNAAHTIAEVDGDASAGKGIITVSTLRGYDDVAICISDTGKGIPKAVRNRIFDPFFSTKDIGKGSGQGLSIARKIVVDKHGGSLDFETEEGKGTTFIIRLPVTGPEVMEV